MDYIDSLLELAIEEDSIEEYKYRVELLQEFHYSKQELQDPEILKKILEKTKSDTPDYQEKLATISLLLSTLLSVVTGTLTKSFKLGIASFFPIMIGVLSATYGILNKIYYTDDKLNKNILEIKNKVTKLKEKANKLSDKNESKKIIDNCDKVLKSIDDYEKKEKKKKENAEKDKQNKLDNYINKPYTETNMGGEFRNILRHLKEKGIKSDELYNSFSKNYKSLDKVDALEYMFGTGYRLDNEKKEYPQLFKKYGSLADKDGKVYEITNNDDNIDFVSPIDYKLYSMQTDNKIYTIPKNLYKYYYV